MAGTKEIKRRIKSVKNTKKITKAMELVAASKMKRAVMATLASRLYAEYSWEILTSIVQNMEDSLKEQTHPFFIQKPLKNILLVLITSNRGLCGAYNAQVIKKALVVIKKNKDINVDILAIGKKGDTAMRRVGKNIIATFTDIPSSASFYDISPVSEVIFEEYKKGSYDKVLVAYTKFTSPLVQTPSIKQVLPVSRTELKELIDELSLIKDAEGKMEVSMKIDKKINYLFEGNQEKFMERLVEKLVEVQRYQMFLESDASEQSARMVAMKNASDASGEMIDDLTLMFNKARQANITREISEISAGMASVN
jgi:F-type H+-transporting ATPase subunit gamma